MPVQGRKKACGYIIKLENRVERLGGAVGVIAEAARLAQEAQEVCERGAIVIAEDASAFIDRSLARAFAISADPKQTDDEVIEACADVFAVSAAGVKALKEGVPVVEGHETVLGALDFLASVGAWVEARRDQTARLGGMFRDGRGKPVKRTGAEVVKLREDFREYMARRKAPDYVHPWAVTGTLDGQLAMTAKRSEDNTERGRRAKSRVADALRAANTTPPVDCDGTLASGSLQFKVKRSLARLVDEPNPPSSWAEAEARAKRFRAISGRQTRAELYAETPKKWVCPRRGKYTVEVPWPGFQKKRSSGIKTRPLVNPATGEIYFAKEEDAIDHKYAWYDAGYPPDWIKPKKRKKPRRN